VSTGSRVPPHLRHSLLGLKEEKLADMRLIIEPKENYSLCCEKETTKENFIPKPPQTYHLL